MSLNKLKLVDGRSIYFDNDDLIELMGWRGIGILNASRSKKTTLAVFEHGGKLYKNVLEISKVLGVGLYAAKTRARKVVMTWPEAAQA